MTSHERSSSVSAWLWLGFALIILCAFWFASAPNGVLIGDDLGLVYAILHHQYDGSLWQAVSEVSAGKYRPVTNLVLAVIVPRFGANYTAYEVLNILLELANAGLLALLLHRFSRGSAAITVLGVAAFVTSRFSYYEVMQVWGVMEALGLGLTLLIVWELSASQIALSNVVRAIFWYVLVIYSDERYLVDALFIATAIVVAWRRDGLRTRTAAVAGMGLAAVIASSVILKSAVFHTHLLVGTGGTLVAFRPADILHFFFDALGNLTGFNLGPDYLSGRDLANAGLGGLVWGMLVTAPLLVLVALMILPLARRQSVDLSAVLLAAALFIPVVATSTVTIRQEFRWLYTPFALVLLGAAWASVRVSPDARNVARWAVLCMYAANIGCSTYYRQFLSNVYFFYSMGVGRAVLQHMDEDHLREVVLADHGDATFPGWVFMGSKFVDLYEPGRVMKFVDEAPEARLTDSPAEVLVVRGAGVVVAPMNAEPDGGEHLATSGVGLKGLSSGAPSSPGRSASRARGERTTYDFLRHFTSGTINSNRHVDTPTGTGAFVMPWQSRGIPVSTLTVLATFRYRYAGLTVTRGTNLVFAVSRPYTIGTSTLAFVDVESNRRVERVFQRVLPPAGSDGMAWEDATVDLSAYRGRSVAVTFGADSTTGDQTAAWIAFAQPRLVIVRAAP